jgi:homoserine dehydrogenase
MRADLALVGFGNVGRTFARLLDDRRRRLLADHDLECRVVAIATRTRGCVHSADGLDAAAAAKRVDAGGRVDDSAAGSAIGRGGALECITRLAASDAPLRVLVETTTLSIEEGRPAIDHVEAALNARCHAVTANKGPAAFAWRRLQSLADTNGVSFLFEGAVMDGIPVFNLIRETMPAVDVLGFRGVINSTTNEILTALEDGEEFAPALARMQAAGIAEADPSLDIDGWDAAAKAAALANVLFDARTNPHEVDRTGIGPDSGDPARAAVRQGKRLRLVASARRGERPVVRPVALPASDLLAGLRGTANAIVFETDLLGDVAICQLGGGLTQTAYALLSDLVSVRRWRQSRPAMPAHRTP